MVIQALNSRARERYVSFVTAMGVVEEQFDELDRAIGKVKSSSDKWQASPDELRAMRRTAHDHLLKLREIAKKYETELVSREWRV